MLLSFRGLFRIQTAHGVPQKTQKSHTRKRVWPGMALYSIFAQQPQLLLQPQLLPPQLLLPQQQNRMMMRMMIHRQPPPPKPLLLQHPIMKYLLDKMIGERRGVSQSILCQVIGPVHLPGNTFAQRPP